MTALLALVILGPFVRYAAALLAQAAVHRAKRRRERFGPAEEVQKARAAAARGLHPVWLSRQEHKGGLRHWVLIIEDVKYELLKSGARQKPCPVRLDVRATQGKVKGRTAGEVNDFHVVNLGWTTYSAQRVAELMDLVERAEPEYDLLRNNCQWFVRKMANLVVEEKGMFWALVEAEDLDQAFARATGRTRVGMRMRATERMGMWI